MLGFVAVPHNDDDAILGNLWKILGKPVKFCLLGVFVRRERGDVNAVAFCHQGLGKLDIASEGSKVYNVFIGESLNAVSIVGVEVCKHAVHIEVVVSH